MSNGYGNVRITREADMAAYDRAPPQLRWLLRNATSLFSAQHMLARYWEERQNGRSHAQALAACRRRILIRDQENTHLAYGPTHPEAEPRRDH